MAEHTPGPWVVGPVDDTIVTHLGKDGVRYEVAAVDGDYNQPDEWPVMEANARLIAAAPDFFSAAKKLIEAWDARTTRAQQIVTGKSDADLQKQAMAAIEGLRAAISRAQP